ncbi:hypothetical protein OUZ56_023745 [Daphnia magna]|uniref:Uncharacterized protein n=1 Tax=Daphnia magna TaxID=35525 RepID=A0ABR0AZE9_9CRUS|nr:hypothetical protein OUZ56_023745 [Daphnia magna]
MCVYNEDTENQSSSNEQHDAIASMIGGSDGSLQQKIGELYFKYEMQVTDKKHKIKKNTREAEAVTEDYIAHDKSSCSDHFENDVICDQSFPQISDNFFGHLAKETMVTLCLGLSQKLIAIGGRR